MIPLQTDQAAHLCKHAEFSIKTILKQVEIPEESFRISESVLAEATNSFLKDIYRIDEHQRGDVSLSKFAGYWAFWLRKLKPIVMLEEGWPTDINERVALQFAISIIIATRSSSRFSDQIWVQCDADHETTCDGAKCFFLYIQGFLKFHNNFMEKDILHTLRKRTFGPHHFALLLEQLMYASCQKKHFNNIELAEINGK